MANNITISLDGLTKRFDSFTAVNNISFSLGKGEVLGFLGPNGAGKSTTMKMLTGYLPITQGSASICGYDVVSAPLYAQERIGYLPEGAPLYGDMSSIEFLRFVAEVRGFRGTERNEKVENAVNKLELGTLIL